MPSVPRLSAGRSNRPEPAFRVEHELRAGDNLLALVQPLKHLHPISGSHAESQETGLELPGADLHEHELALPRVEDSVGGESPAYDIAIWVRVAAQLYLVAMVVRDVLRPEHDPVRAQPDAVRPDAARVPAG